MVKRVLMIAYHYPPVRGSSGVQRTLKFSRYLTDYGWEPIVLTAHPRAYPEVGNDQMHEIPSSITVKRAFSLDTARHLSHKGAYPGLLAWPDRWVSWWFGAIPVGLRLIRKYKPDAIWSTYPIATAHLIGLTLARLTGLPWVADFRDSMTEEAYPTDPNVRRVSRWIEARTVYRAQRVVFTAPGTARMYAERYPRLAVSHWQTIANGYDEENFAAAEIAAHQRNGSGRQIELVHSGLLYPSERDPTAFFDALGMMRIKREISAEDCRIVLRAPGHDDQYQSMLEARNIQDIVSIEPAIAYKQALAEMLTADGLLLFQASNCNHQIPAKVYEYLRARRPILALTDINGDTRLLLRDSGIDTIVPLNDKMAIRAALIRFMNLMREQRAPLAHEEFIAKCSRRAQTAELAQLLDSLCADPEGSGERGHERNPYPRTK